MPNNDFEKAMILFLIAQIDDSFKQARQIVETQKVIGFMTPQLAMKFNNMFVSLLTLQEDREQLVKLAREEYGMDIN